MGLRARLEVKMDSEEWLILGFSTGEGAGLNEVRGHPGQENSLKPLQRVVVHSLRRVACLGKSSEAGLSPLGATGLGNSALDPNFWTSLDKAKL